MPSRRGRARTTRRSAASLPRSVSSALSPVALWRRSWRRSSAASCRPASAMPRRWSSCSRRLPCLLMMWPGRFLLGVYLTVGAHAFIALWTMFYVIWDRFTGVQLNAVSGVQAVSGDLSPATLLASNIAQLLIVGGYFGLTALAFAIAMHATAALGRAAVGAAGAGFGRMASAGEGAVRSANKWGGSRWQATNQQVRSSARQGGGMSANATSTSAAGHFAMQARAQGRAQPASAGGSAAAAPAPRAVRVGGSVQSSPASRITS